jgi:predicted RNase H-like HicB family nuclease
MVSEKFLEDPMARSGPYKYDPRIRWSEEDAAFVVDVPDLPGCMADGDTPANAAANAQEAIRLWIETAKEFGDPVPEPR